MYLVLYNPLSKNSKSNIKTHKLVMKLKKENIPFRLKSIVKIDDLEAYLVGKEHFTKIILLGGDGTINRFVNDTIDYEIVQDIYLKRNGSGNDFLRSLKLDDSKSQTIMEATFDNEVKTHFINGSGMGIDGYVGYLINQSKRKGKFRYFLNTIKGLILYKPSISQIIIDDKEYNFKKTYFITANNGKYFGGGMQISPKADLFDEELDIIVAHSMNKILVLMIFVSIYLGKHTSFKKYVFHAKGKKVTATFNNPQIAQCDGETFIDKKIFTAQSSGKKIHLKYYEDK